MQDKDGKEVMPYGKYSVRITSMQVYNMNFCSPDLKSTNLSAKI